MNMQIVDEEPKGEAVTLKAGRELDVLVAERVMGWKHYQSRRGLRLTFFLSPETYATHYIQSQNLVGVDNGNEENAPRYSTEIVDVYSAVQKMRERGYGWTICTHKDGWFVRCFELPDEGLKWRHSTIVKRVACGSLMFIGARGVRGNRERKIEVRLSFY